jgi:hypothetical protein
VRYYTKVVLGRSVSAHEAWLREPDRRADWFAAGPPGVDVVDGARLDAAKAAGMAALREGFGSVLPGGQCPCGICPPCQYGQPAGCRWPVSRATAILRRKQAADPVVVALRDLDAAEGAMLAAEVEMLGP